MQKLGPLPVDPTCGEQRDREGVGGRERDRDKGMHTC